MDWITDPRLWIALATLTGLEIVLGIDNIIFISILVSKLPEHKQPGARTLGLALAMIMRVILLVSLTWIMGLTRPLFHILGNETGEPDLLDVIFPIPVGLVVFTDEAVILMNIIVITHRPEFQDEIQAGYIFPDVLFEPAVGRGSKIHLAGDGGDAGVADPDRIVS